MAAILNGTELYLSGFVGDNFFDDGFTSGDVINALASVGNASDITLRINSGGGIATEGAAIYAALAQHKGQIKVVVEGIAASAASLIAMAGDERVMMPGAVMMIHDPAGVTFGDVAAHEMTIKALNALGDAYAGIYADIAGITPDEARQMMREETWMDGPTAIAKGFATGSAMDPANDDEPTAFAYGIYAKAPQRLVALASARGWQPRTLQAAPAALRQRKEPTMTVTAGTAPASEEIPTTEEVTVETPAADPVATAAEVAAICAEGSIAFLASELISAKATPDQARARAEAAKDIRAAVEQARHINSKIEASLADSFIRQNKPVMEVRAALLDQLVANQSPEIPSPHAPQADDGAKTAKAGWDKAIARQNARIS